MPLTYRHPLGNGTRRWQMHATSLERCHICFPPAAVQRHKPQARSLQTSSREGFQAGPVSPLCLQDFSTLKAQNGSTDPSLQGTRLCAYPVSLRHHQPIAPALFGVTETVNHALCYLFISPGFITVLPSFLHTASNIFKYM